MAHATTLLVKSARATFVFFLYFCGGIQYLAWDAGYGFAFSATYASGWAVVAASIVLTAVASIIIEDYVHSAAKIPALVLIRLGCFALAASGILAVLRVALAGREPAVARPATSQIPLTRCCVLAPGAHERWT